jgi:hypothetical protein
LKKYYDSCEQEICYDNIRRRSDLKIFSSTHPEREPIYIEFCVTHASDEAKHATDNIAIKPTSVDRLRPVYLEEIIVTTTDYDNAKIYVNLFPEKIDLPIGGQVLRSSNNIKNGKIIWNDD